MKKITEFKIRFDRELILSTMGCMERGTLYNRVLCLYEKIEAEAYTLLKPCAVLTFNEEAEKEVIYVLLTVGEKISERIEQLFYEEEYLEGYLMNVLADDYLFRMDTAIQQILIEKCNEKQRGISRWEEPKDHSLGEWQKVIWQKTNALEMAGVELTKGMMYRPEKTMGILFYLSDDKYKTEIRHNCNLCQSPNCPWRG